jgi:3-(3-hydroxy-phenyl)propionate hydroxylase
MPVWQGQGYNSGIRDANNLSWKLIAVIRGLCGSKLLETYTVERRNHASSMISLSTLVGRIFSPTNRFIAFLRDAVFGVLNRIPPVRDYVVQMRFKPMPRYTDGGVVPVATTSLKSSAIGQLFIQPWVGLRDGRIVRLDDAIGNRFAIIAWGGDPSIYFSAEAARIWRTLDGGVFVARSQTEMSIDPIDVSSMATPIGDTTLALKDWFSAQDAGIAILRPDRFVAAVCSPQTISETIGALAQQLDLRLPLV